MAAAQAASSYDTKLLSTLTDIFPEACPKYLKTLCDHKKFNLINANAVVESLLKDPNYPKRQKELAKKEIKVTSVEQKRRQITVQQMQYTNKFNVENFLEVFPDPDGYFQNPKKKLTIDISNKDRSLQYATQFLKSTYNLLPQQIINSVFRNNNYHLIKTANKLDIMMKSKKELMSCSRKVFPCYQKIENIPLLQEIAYLKHRTEIADFVNKQKIKAEEERNYARRNGLLQSCNCCCEEDIMPKDMVQCEDGCEFCKTCVQRSAELNFSEGNFSFSCLSACKSYFSLRTLQSVLPPKLFSKLAQRKQLVEVKAAGIENIEVCPFCDFATILAPGDKIFRCLNPDCMKESCRECKRTAHIPLRCNEFEDDDEVKIRTYIEDKMTEALLRKCYQCGLKFIKSEGCNKMVCSCGAKMCYICSEPVKDYRHFNGQGGTNFHLCPLFSDTLMIHEEAVVKGGEAAKAEVGPRKLTIDPTADIKEYYKRRRLEDPHPRCLFSPLRVVNQV